MLWNENSKRGSMSSTNNLLTQHIPLIYYLNFFSTCAINSMNTCQNNPQPSERRKKKHNNK